MRVRRVGTCAWKTVLTTTFSFNATVLGSKDADKEGAADADNGKEEEEEAASE